MHKQRPRTRLLLLLLIPIMTCVGVAAVALLLRPRTFGSHQETIGFALEQRQVVFRTVEISQNWPEAVNYYAYGHQIYPFNVNVIVYLMDGGEVPGRMECLDDRRRCSLNIPRLKIDNERLPDVSERRAWPWEPFTKAMLEKVKTSINP